MGALSAQISYRPLRIGWCLRSGNTDDLRKAIRWSHTLWGGRYNPVVVVDSADAQDIVNSFQVDILYPVSDDPEVIKFIKNQPHLPWSEFKKSFSDYKSPESSMFLDIYHPARHIYERYVKNVPTPSVLACVFEWDLLDPLKDIFLITYGVYPSKKELGYDYAEFVLKTIHRNPLHQKVHKILTVC